MASRTRGVVAGLALLTAATAGCGGAFGRGEAVDTTLPTLPPTTTTTAPAVVTTAGPSQYEIARGDTLRKIAAKFGTTVEAILAANPDVKDPNKIQAGQKILVPPPTVPPPPATTVAPAPAG